MNPYFSQRRFDRTATILFTDTLIRLFSGNIPIIHRLCGGALACDYPEVRRQKIFSSGACCSVRAAEHKKIFTRCFSLPQRHDYNHVLSPRF